MSDIHILVGDGRGNVSSVMHFTVPDETNLATVNWRTALVQSGIGGTTQLPDDESAGWGITAAEKAKIESGELYEHLVSLSVEGDGVSIGAVQAALQKKYTRERTRKLLELQARLKYFGYTESES